MSSNPNARSAESARRALRVARGRAGQLARKLGVYDSLAKIRPAGAPAKPASPTAPGMVETCTEEEIIGWVSVPKGAAPTRVTLHLGGIEVGATWATDVLELNSWGEIRSFRFRVKDLWKFARTTNKVVVRSAGRPLPIYREGMFVRPRTDGDRSLTVLKEKLEAGWVFSSNGKFQLSKKLDDEWLGKVLSLYDEVCAILREAHGYEIFAMYGSMLGAVREGGVIGHDFDFDAGFISRHTQGRAAAEEMKQIAFTLIDRGIDVECRRTALHLHDAQRPAIRIDLFHLFFDSRGVLQFPFGAAGTTRVRAEDWRGVTKVGFGSHEVLVPVNGEQMLEAIYGGGWRQPQPGFNWSRARKVRAGDALISLPIVEEVYWANFYARTEYTSGSTFFDLVNAREDTPGSVIDIGCGDGRDAFAFGVAGRRVVGLDRSHIGVRHATKKAASMGFPDLVRFQGVDVGDAEALGAVIDEALAASPGEPVLFYARFFLHSIPAEVQETLMAVIRDRARAGDMFAAEFRTEKDEPNLKVHTKHYRRFQNGPAFGERLVADYGFEVIFEQEGTGLSPYKGEDPELYRVIARRVSG